MLTEFDGTPRALQRILGFQGHLQNVARDHASDAGINVWFELSRYLLGEPMRHDFSIIFRENLLIASSSSLALAVMGMKSRP